MSGLLLTGARGCLGGLILTSARRAGLPVVAVDRRLVLRYDGAAQSAAPHDGTAAGIARLLGDAGDLTLVHCAAFNSPGDRIEDAEALIDGNLRFGFSVLEAARAAGCRRVVNFGSFWQVDSQGRPSAVNAYAAMKSAFQLLLEHACAAHGVAALSLCLADTYGEGDPRPRLINLLCQAALTGRALAMSEGTQQIAPVHLDDVLAAVDRALAELGADPARGTHRRCYVLGPETLSIRALVARFERVTGVGVPVRWGARPRLPRLPEAPYAGGPVVPGWRPAIGLDEGLARVFAWQRAMGGA